MAATDAVDLQLVPGAHDTCKYSIAKVGSLGRSSLRK